jgi:hypothetical protein
MRRILKAEDGKYHVSGKSFSILEGSRQQVGHGTAYKTSGGLTKKDLVYTKRGRWVSKKKHMTAKKEKNLEKYGFFAQKGKFGYVKRDAMSKKSRKMKKSKKC